MFPFLPLPPVGPPLSSQLKLQRVALVVLRCVSAKRLSLPATGRITCRSVPGMRIDYRLWDAAAGVPPELGCGVSSRLLPVTRWRVGCVGVQGQARRGSALSPHKTSYVIQAQKHATVALATCSAELPTLPVLNSARSCQKHHSTVW
jgi:hypothetical protein